MTREEAIERLEDTFEGWNMWVMDNDSPASKMSKALGMAIAALLDVEALKKSANQNDDIKAALEALKKDSGYLFEEDKTPPPYSGGAGSGNQTPPETKVSSLADALRERYNSN